MMVLPLLLLVYGVASDCKYIKILSSCNNIIFTTLENVSDQYINFMAITYFTWQLYHQTPRNSTNTMECGWKFKHGMYSVEKIFLNEFPEKSMKKVMLGVGNDH